MAWQESPASNSDPSGQEITTARGASAIPALDGAALPPSVPEELSASSPADAAGAAPAGIPALMSYTAGTYVCNSIMYNVLYLLDRRFPGVKGGFIHVPYATAQGVGKPNGTPTMEITTMAKAIEAAIEAAVSVEEDATDIMGETH